jgi:hypothetical protein
MNPIGGFLTMARQDVPVLMALPTGDEAASSTNTGDNFGDDASNIPAVDDAASATTTTTGDDAGNHDAAATDGAAYW